MDNKKQKQNFTQFRKNCEECLNDEFECADGTCIIRTRLCDGVPDCDSGDDEDENLCHEYNATDEPDTTDEYDREYEFTTTEYPQSTTTEQSWESNPEFYDISSTVRKFESKKQLINVAAAFHTHRILSRRFHILLFGI